MCLVFFGIIGCLFVILLIAFFVLLKLQKLDKKKIMIAVFAVLLPLFIATAVLAPFAYIDYANGNYPNAQWHKPPAMSNFKEFRGNAVDGTSHKIFSYNANNLENSGSSALPYQRFEVDEPAAFEEYLVTVEAYSSAWEDETVTTFFFEKDGNFWSLKNYKSNPDVYYWYYEARSSES